MPLTPADVHNIDFKKTSIGKRGYDEEQVDAFLDELEQALIGLIEENHELRNRVARDGASNDAGADPRMATALDMMTAQLDRVRRDKETAEQAARAMRTDLAQVRTRGATVTADDRERGSRVLAMVERTADKQLGEARRVAGDLLSEARSTALRITGEAVANADALARDARQRHQNAMDGLDARRRALLQEISELNALERDYRSRLTTHVEGQLNALAGRGPAATAQVAAPTSGSAGPIPNARGRAYGDDVGRDVDA